jgi:hypothetical protein
MTATAAAKTNIYKSKIKVQEKKITPDYHTVPKQLTS